MCLCSIHRISKSSKSEINHLLLERRIGAYISDLIIGHLQDIFHDLIDFTDQLHISVLDAIVNHLHEMTRARRTDLERSGEHKREDDGCRFRTQSQQGWPSALAAIVWKIGLTCSLEEISSRHEDEEESDRFTKLFHFHRAWAMDHIEHLLLHRRLLYQCREILCFPILLLVSKQTNRQWWTIDRWSLTIESLYNEFPPSMMMSPLSRNGIIVWMKSSTGLPAWTRSITRRGFFNSLISSSIEWAPMIFVPFASLPKNWSTFETVRLKHAT